MSTAACGPIEAAVDLTQVIIGLSHLLTVYVVALLKCTVSSAAGAGLNLLRRVASKWETAIILR